MVALVDAGDVTALNAVEIKTYSSSPKAIDRFGSLPGRRWKRALAGAG